jgi:FtsP/CotA-like multicopper oxidase with cupredoxin domain
MLAPFTRVLMRVKNATGTRLLRATTRPACSAWTLRDDGVTRRKVSPRKHLIAVAETLESNFETD